MAWRDSGWNLSEDDLVCLRGAFEETCVQSMDSILTMNVSEYILPTHLEVAIERIVAKHGIYPHGAKFTLMSDGRLMYWEEEQC